MFNSVSKETKETLGLSRTALRWRGLEHLWLPEWRRHPELPRYWNFNMDLLERVLYMYIIYLFIYLYIYVFINLFYIYVLLSFTASPTLKSSRTCWFSGPSFFARFSPFLWTYDLKPHRLANTGLRTWIPTWNPTWITSCCAVTACHGCYSTIFQAYKPMRMVVESEHRAWDEVCKLPLEGAHKAAPAEMHGLRATHFSPHF